jgi:putative endonuclease
MAKVWFVYIIANYANSVLYVGVTNNLERRIWEHKTGSAKSSFSKRYRLYKLLWFQEFPSPIEAIGAEKKIKGWRRLKKLDLIRVTNPTFRDLGAHFVH